ncbi:15570_t:CDS:2, partial [Gigaspora margarita]
STSTDKEIEYVRKPNSYSDHKHENMQTDAISHETQTESNKGALNEESTYNESTCPDEEMVTELSDPLRDELSDLYGIAGNKVNLLLVTAENNASIGDLQASMLSQVSNIELDNFKIVMHKKLNVRKASSTIKKEGKRKISYKRAEFEEIERYEKVEEEGIINILGYEIKSYHLRHIEKNKNREYPWCREKIQRIEHFSYSCSCIYTTYRWSEELLMPEAAIKQLEYNYIRFVDLTRGWE